DGGVHSHYSHMIALANAAHEAGVTEIFVHAFTDGRDTSPTGGADYLKTCEDELQRSGAKIVTVVGRYFAMDRDRRWDRTKKAWDGFDRQVRPQVHFVTLTQYDVTYPSPFIFGPEKLAHILGEVVSAVGKSQLRIAETEKYAHVTYFFNGGIERAFPGEDRKI